MKTGADISHHQATFDPTRYFASEDFVILKATEGGSFRDPAFRARWQQVAGHPRGAYAFGRPGGATVDAQADHFIATVRAAGWTDRDVWVLDLEDAGGVGPQSLVAWADRWCNRVRAALGGPGLFYTYPAFWHATMGSPARVPGGAMLWWAEYDQAPDRAPTPPHCWQYTSQASVPGVSGPCDHNRMTDDAFTVLFGGQEADMNQAEHDALMWLRQNAGLLRDQGVRMTDHGDPDIPGRANHLAAVRSDIAQLQQGHAQLGAQLREIKAALDGLALGKVEGDLEFTGLAHIASPPPPAS